MLGYILQATICLAAFYAVYALLLSRETFFGINRWYLLGTLCLSLIIPAFPDLIQASGDATLVTYTLEPVVIGIQDVSIALTAAPETPWWVISLLVIYWIGVSVLLFKFIMNLRSIWHLYHAGTIQYMQGFKERLVITGTHLPFSFFHWIFLPHEHNMSDDELREVLRHEAAHVSALHSLDVILMELACIFLWPSPVIYFYRRSLRRVHEYLADAEVLKQTSLKQYGHLLLSQSVPGMQLALANHFFQHQLKQRILMMTKDKSRRSAMIKYAILVPILLLTIALFAFKPSHGSGTVPDINTITQDSVPAVYKVVDEMPRFPGCEDSGLKGMDLHNCSMKKLLEHCYTQLKYPEAARKAKVEGRSVAQFIVRSDGSITDAKIVRSIGHDTDEAVLEMIGTFPKWRPGYQEGKAVDVEFTIPVSFKLPQSTPEAPSEDKAINSDKDPVYQVVDQMPRFAGCEGSPQEKPGYDACTIENLIAFIQEHLRYPETAKAAGIEGKSIVSFTINKNGEIVDPEIVKSIGHGTDEAVLDMLSGMPAWIPGKHKGEVVNVQMALPVSFVLPKEKTQANPSVNKPASGFDIEVFPVPAGDQLNYNLTLPANSGELVIDLVNSQGQSVHQEVKVLSFSKEGEFTGSIEPGKLAPGTYVLRAIWNNEVVTKSVVIQ